MNRPPLKPEPPDDIDERYRRVSALDPSRPSEAVRAAVLAHAERLAAGRAAGDDARVSRLPRLLRGRGFRPVVSGTLAAAAIAGLVLAPRWMTPGTHPAPPPPGAATRPVVPTAALPAAAPAPQRQAYMPRAASANLQRAPSADAAAPAAAPSAKLRTSAGARSSAAPATAQFAETAAVAVDPGVSFRRAAQDGDLAALERLLLQQSDINARDAQGRSALMLATVNGRAGAVAALLAHGADPNAADAQGRTPLAAALAAGQSDIAATLRRCGAHE